MRILSGIRKHWKTIGYSSLGLTLMMAMSLQAQSIPTPESVLGFHPGEDFQLATYEESLKYFRLLDASTDRMMLVNTGETSEGRAWYIAIVSSAENLANLDEYRSIAAEIASPGHLTDSEARDMASRGKAVVDINGGLHASEVARRSTHYSTCL